MLIVALVLAVIGLAALVTAVVTSNELVAWVCIAASVIGVILLIVDAIRERQNRRVDDDGAVSVTAAAESAESSATAETTAYSETGETVDATYSTFDADYPDEEVVVEEQADEVSAAIEAADADEAGEADEADEPTEEPDEKSSGQSGSR